ncbi:DUF4167 domain-containing protein [Tropicimonas sp. S265A]|uniref:DUF4167 domain-containing protein n=1 Tax=Tropicimonas sp. S265A TaxID=3415134 RepID=UPI003C7D5EF0
MRSSNKRSRNKNNRRSVGNVVNRVFDSSGPEGKVRGTPQQIIEKYQTLARDAQLANDRVAVENFQQHAEHYTRMLAEALKEQEARREQQEQHQNRGRDRQQSSNNRSEQPGEGDQPQAEQRSEQPRAEQRPSEPVASEPVDQPQTSADVIDLSEGDGDSGLVETPETKPARKPRRSRRKKPEDGAGDSPAGEPADTPAE